MTSVCKFLTRAGCHLCDEARPRVEAEVARQGWGLVEIDVDSDASLADEFGLRVPVLLGPDDSVLAEGRIENARLRRALRSLRS